MIYDSYIWKKTLKKDLKKIKLFLDKFYKKYQKCSKSDDSESELFNVAFIRLQKFCVYSSIIIRKLIEANKMSDEAMSNSVKILTHERIDSRLITFFNDHKINEFYDLESPKKGTLSIANLTNCFIHSFHFIVVFDWKGDEEDMEMEKLNGFYFSSDTSKEKCLYFITLEEISKLVDIIVKDSIVSVTWENGKFTKKSSVKTEISEETKMLINESESHKVKDCDN